MTQHAITSFLSLACLYAAGKAQVQLVGGANYNFGGSQRIMSQAVCNVAATWCQRLHPLPTTPYAGGSAYDPNREVLWDTDGLQLASVQRYRLIGDCDIRCRPFPVPGIPAGAVATGLAFEEDGTALGRLWCVDSALGLQMRAWQGVPCPGPGSRCSIQPFMPTPAHVPGGLAVSEFHRTIFYSASDFGSATPNNWVFGAPLANPCAPICRVQVVGCAGVALRAITGLAFNDCTSEMYITDGSTTLVARYTPPGGGLACMLQAVSCCAATSKWYGLCLEPAHATYLGSSCLQAPCPVCPFMRFDPAGGDAVIGNSTFGYRLSGAPPGSNAVCFLNVGACTSGRAFLCGAVYLPLAPPPVVIGSAITAGGACAGVANHPFPIPLVPAFCGISLAAQDLVICPAMGFGLSGAVCATISDS